MSEDIIRIDNDRTELAALLGEHFLEYSITPESFLEGATVEKYWKSCRKGVFLLLTASRKQPMNGASVHITVLVNGTIRNANAGLLKRRLIGVQRVIAV